MPPHSFPVAILFLALFFFTQVFCECEVDKRADEQRTICNIMNYGASQGTRNDGADVGVAIMKAYTECVQKSNGPVTLLIPSGKSFRLMSRVVFDKARNIIIQWNGDVHLADMHKVQGFNLNGAMIQFTHCNDVKLLGKGIFFGYGVEYRLGSSFGNDVPMEKRPRMIMFYKALNVEVGGLTLNDSPSYHLSVAGENVHVHDISITQPLPTHGMTDGVSLSVKNCLVERVSVQNGDDCVVLKSPSSNCLVRDIDCKAGGGVGLGTVGHNGEWAISNITFDEITLTESMGATIKSFPDAKGYVRNIKFNNIQFLKVNYAIFVQMFFLKNHNQPQPMTWTDISFTNFTGTTTDLVKPPILIHCSSVASCSNLVIKNFFVKQAGTRRTPIYVENACGIGPGLKPCTGSHKRHVAALHRRKTLSSH